MSKLGREEIWNLNTSINIFKSNNKQSLIIPDSHFTDALTKSGTSRQVTHLVSNRARFLTQAWPQSLRPNHDTVLPPNLTPEGNATPHS